MNTYILKLVKKFQRSNQKQGNQKRKSSKHVQKNALYSRLPKWLTKYKSKTTAILFILIFAGIGSYMLYTSRAATPPAYHVVASQGATDPASLYALVTWNRVDPTATGYDVLRDGIVIGTTAISGDAWDDLDYKDTSVQASRMYSYQVKPKYANGSTGAVSGTYKLYVRSTADIGGGKIYAVDQQPGTTDLAKAQSAVDAAKANGGGVVLFGARTYSLSAALLLSETDNIILRGSGKDQTFIQPGFSGSTTSCGDDSQLIKFQGRRSAMATRLTAPIAVGTQTVKVDSTSALAVGMPIVLYEAPPASPRADPGTGTDERHRWDANEITAIDSTNKTVTFKYPWSQAYTTAVPWSWIEKGRGNGIERLTLQGRNSSEQTYYQLIYLDTQANFSMADSQGRWANRNFLKSITAYKVNVTGFQGGLGDPNSAASPCRYKFSTVRTSNFSFIGGEMGEPGQTNNFSAITTQRSQRTLVRNSNFWSHKNYAFNEHGGGSRHYTFENNYVAVGSSAKAGVYLGHNEFGFSGSGIIRNNTFEGNSNDIYMSENSYEIMILDNVMRNTANRSVSGYGWAGSSTAADLYGSIRWIIARNNMIGVKYGIVLGERTSPLHPYLGVKDVIISSNKISSLDLAINLQGDSSNTKRFQVANNSGTNKYIKPPFVAGDYWSGNSDGVNYGAAADVPWAAESFAWHNADNYPPVVFASPTDTTPPTQPTNLSSPSKTTSSTNLAWSPSTDDTGVTGYDVYRNKIKVSTTATNSYSDSGLSASTTYSYHVIARDAAVNNSPASAALNVATQTPIPVTTQTPAPVTTDTIAPIVTISSPASGSTIDRSVTINAKATDNTAVTNMKVYIDGNLKTSSASGSISYGWNPKKAARGAHTMTVKAYDAAGNIGQRSVTVYR